ncbi:MAG: hypothetical protein ACI9B7_001687 [Oleispira sp.]|jgi:uncharacterized protein (TIGR02099 family)
MKRWLGLIWAQCWLTGVVCLVLLALYTSLGRQLIPLVETLELDIEKVLSKQLGVAVDIESLTGEWVWFSPRIQVNHIQLGDIEQGLKIQRLDVKLDVSASLYYRVPVFDKINLYGAQLPFSQDEQGNWYLSQFLLTAKDNSQTVPDFWSGDKPLWLELLGQQGEIHLYNWQVSIESYNRVAKNITILDLRLRNKGLQHWLEGEIQLGESAARLKTQFEVEGDLWDFSKHNGKGYLQLATQSWEPWIPDYSSAWQFEKLTAGAHLWVDVKNGQIDNLDGYIDLPEFSLLKSDNEQSQDVSFRDGRITLAGRRSDDEWHLWFDSDVDWLSDVIPPKPNGRISWLPNIEGVQLALNEIDLAQAAFWLQDFQFLPEKYLQYITNIQPTGLVKQVRINMLPQREWLWGVSLDLSDAGIQGWRGIPRVENLTATLDLDKTKGRLKTTGIDALLHFPKLYDNGWPLTDLKSDIFWQISPEYLRLVSPSLRANYQQASLNGSFSFYTPLKENMIEPQLNLLIGIQNLELLEQKAFVPKVAAVGVSNWLTENIKAGQATQASFLFSSSLVPELTANSQTIKLYADILNADLTYLPDWPEISQVKASLMVDVPNVDIWVHRGATLGGILLPDSTQIKVRNEGENTTWMTLKGKLAGDASEGIKYFSATPLQDQVAGVFDQWQVQGKVESELHAHIPLSPGDKKNALSIRLNSQLHDVDIEMMDLGLSFNNINGIIKFDTEQGLTAKALKGEAFSGLTTADISSTKESSGFDIRINAQGEAKAEAIKTWLPLFILKPISGDFNYTLDFQIRPIERGGLLLNIASDLRGINIDAPLPLAKQDEQTLPFSMSVKKVHDLRIGFRYGELANGVVALEKGELTRGQVYLGTTQTYLPSDNGLSIRGNIPHALDAKAWWDFWQRIKPEIDESIDEEKKTAVLTHIDLSAPEVNAWQQMMGPSHIIGNYKWGQWDFTLDSDLVKGGINLPDDLANNAIEMNLDYIHMPVTGDDPNNKIKFGAAGTLDPLQNFDPTLIPDIDVKVAEVFLGTNNYGRWDMTTRQEYGLTRIHVKDSLMKNLTIKGDVDWRKDGQGHSTHLNLLRIQSENLGDSQRAFRKVASIEAKNTNIDVDLKWQGSPLGFNYESLNGLAKVSIKKGLLVSDNTGALKAFGVLNFNSISRRLQLDFSDLYESGVAFDILKTRLSLTNGIATFVDPLLINGPSAKFQSSGTINLNNEKIDQKLVVTFPITSSLPLVAVLAGFAPQIAGAIYVTEKLIGEELEQFTSASYTVTGTIEDPKMKIDQAFDNELEGKESRSFKNRFLDIFGLGDDD